MKIRNKLISGTIVVLFVVLSACSYAESSDATVAAASTIEATNSVGANELIGESKENINLWKVIVNDVKTNGFSFAWLIALLTVILGSATILTKMTVWVIDILIKIVPDEVDKKLFKVRSVCVKVLEWVARVGGWLSFTSSKNKK